MREAEKERSSTGESSREGGQDRRREWQHGRRWEEPKDARENRRDYSEDEHEEEEQI